MPVSASTIMFDNPSGTLGTSQSYTSGAYSVTAYGFSNLGDPTDLFGKHDGNDENGVGLAGFSDNEISGTGFIQVYVGGLTGLSFEMGSTTDNEGWKVSQSNTLGAIGTSLVTGNDESFHSVITADKYLTFQATGPWGSDVLLAQLKVEGQVPEPNAAMLMFIGGALIACARARQNPKKR
jgi:hypothetical protein